MERDESLSLQRHFRVLTKIAHVESRLSGHKRQRGVVFYALVNLCDRRACATSVAVGVTPPGAETLPLPTSAPRSPPSASRPPRGRSAPPRVGPPGHTPRPAGPADRGGTAAALCAAPFPTPVRSAPRRWPRPPAWPVPTPA